LVASALWATAALADKTTARTLYAEGQKAYDLGKFDEAATLFERGYAEHPDPVFLYNLGQCHRQLGKNDRALFFYRGYLRNKPDAANRTQVEQLIADLEKARQTQTGGAPPPEPTTPPPPPPAPEPPPVVTAPPAAEPPPEASAPEPPPEASAQTEAEVTMPSEAPSSNTQKILAWGTVGLGAVMIGLGAVFNSQANSKKSEIEDAGQGDNPPLTLDEYNDLNDQGKSKAKMATIFVGLGSVALVGGGVWAYFAHTSTPDSPAGLELDLSDGLRVAYGTRF
jgi:tetratricopeptide (TPR) repeat protein